MYSTIHPLKRVSRPPVRQGLITLLLALCFTVNAANASFEHRKKQRQIYNKALHASSTQDDIRYRQLYRQLSDYPLLSYLEYHQLLARFNTLTDIDIDHFLTTNSDTINAKRLQYLWLKHKARNNDWQGFAKYDRPHFNSPATHCSRLLASGHDRPINTNRHALIRSLWRQSNVQQEPCLILFSNVLQLGIIADSDIWERYLKLFKSNPNNANQLYFYLNARDQTLADQLRRAHAHPHQAAAIYAALTLSNDSAISAYAVNQLSKLAPEQAMSLLTKTKLNTEEQHKSAYYIARQAALFSPSSAYQWLKNIDPLNRDERLSELKICLALATNNWQDTDRLIRQLPYHLQHSPRWQYWATRALEQLSPDEKIQWQNNYQKLAKQRNYYGFLAALRSNSAPQFNDQSKPISPQAKLSDAIVKHNASLQRAVELYHFGATELATQEWQHGIALLNKKQQRVMAITAHYNHWHHQSIRTIIQSQLWDQLNLRFPMAYQHYVEIASSKTSVSKSWLFALIRQASQFNPSYRSDGGGIGLMQLRINHSLSPDDTVALLNPRINIQLGAKHFKKLLERFNHNYPLASAAYEAGPERVERWASRSRQITDLDQWIETIPYQRIRHHVQNTLVFNAIYQHLLGQPIVLLGNNRLFLKNDDMSTAAFAPTSNKTN